MPLSIIKSRHSIITIINPLRRWLQPQRQRNQWTKRHASDKQKKHSSPVARPSHQKPVPQQQNWPSPPLPSFPKTTTLTATTTSPQSQSARTGFPQPSCQRSLCTRSYQDNTGIILWKDPARLLFLHRRTETTSRNWNGSG